MKVFDSSGISTFVPLQKRKSNGLKNPKEKFFFKIRNEKVFKRCFARSGQISSLKIAPQWRFKKQT